ncbi:BMC domain-containing protein [Cellulosilyticum sp. I15G10I2]|uniref:BMC domain-containing protein n=1 Tax=Cellulosilyticum sp. I15G10I2 TaxID=1892843 RepID=UPI00085BBC6B|nr:BMC domain-containing protein [Cellulosilyticum sp. I15G10I2]
MAEDTKIRTIQEYVPGKQITLMHIIAKPDQVIYKKLGLPDEYNEAIGILTITPSEAAIIAGDLCTKAAGVKIGFIDRFSGSVVIVGENSSVAASLEAVMSMFKGRMHFDTVEITRS